MTGWMLVGTALCDDPPRVTTHGEERAIASLASDFPVDAEGTTLGQSFVVDQRLRAALDVPVWGWTAGTEWDLFAGQVAGDTWDLPGDEDARHRESLGVLRARSFVPRKIALGGLAGWLKFDVGLQTSHWGLGMIANDGAHDPLFGRADFGDRVIRGRIATRAGKESPLYLVAATDMVVADDTAELARGQTAFQAVAAALYRRSQGPTAGLYLVRRTQTEADLERQTEAVVVDAYGEVPLDVAGGRLLLAAEAAEIDGATSRTLTYNEREALTVRSGGVCAEARYERDRVYGWVRGGWASPDRDPDDDTLGDFAYDRDYDAGMVLFDQWEGAVEAATYAQLDDPSNIGSPPDGAEALVTEGAFRRAAFVQPAAEVAMRPWARVRAGVLGAWSTGPIQQAFTTGRNGGVPTNARGEETSGYFLGYEIDWAVTLGDTEASAGPAKLWPALLVQGGHLLPGGDLGLDGPVHLVTATARARW